MENLLNFLSPMSTVPTLDLLALNQLLLNRFRAQGRSPSSSTLNSIGATVTTERWRYCPQMVVSQRSSLMGLMMRLSPPTEIPSLLSGPECVDSSWNIRRAKRSTHLTVG